MAIMTGMLLAKGAIGAAQLISGLAKKKSVRPELKVSESTNEAVNRSRTLANSSTRAGRANADQAINQSASNAIQSAKGSTNDVSKLLAVASGVQSSSNLASRDQDALDIQFKQQSEGQYQQSLRQKAYEEQAVHRDKLGKHDEQREEKAAMIGAGIQNLETTANDATSMSMYKKFGYLDGMNGESASAQTQATPAPSGNSVGLNSKYLNNSLSRRMNLSRMRDSFYKGF